MLFIPLFVCWFVCGWCWCWCCYVLVVVRRDGGRCSGGGRGCIEFELKEKVDVDVVNSDLKIGRYNSGQLKKPLSVGCHSEKPVQSRTLILSCSHVPILPVEVPVVESKRVINFKKAMS